MRITTAKKRQLQHLDAAFVSLRDIQLKVGSGAMLGDAYARAGYVEPAEKIMAVITPVAD